MKKKFNDRKSVRTLAVIRNGTSGPSQLIEPKDKNAGDEQPDPQVCPATDISPLIVKTGNKGGPNRETTAPVTPISSKRVRKRPKPRKYGQHDTGNADRLIDAHGEELIFCEQRGSFFVWIGRRWEFDGFIRTELLAERTMRAAFGEAASIEDDDSRNQFLRFVKYSLSRSGIANMVHCAKRKAKRLRVTEFDANPYLLNCRNGTVDLRKGRLRPHRREDLITKMLPFDFDQNATCPRFMRFVERIFRVQDAASDIERYKAERLVNYVQRAFGCAATGKPEKFIFFLWGRGNNGKTTLLETIRAVLSEYSGEIQVESLMVRPREAAGSNAINADLADLKGCRFVSSSEVEQNQRLAVARVKYLTGLGQIRARYLRENFFTFQPTHKLFVDCNHRPIISNSHDAVWNRVKVIPFTVEIPTSEIDTNLPNDLQRELPGILNWVVEGARQYLRDGLQDIPEVSSAIQEYREESDTLKDFFREKCDVEPQKLNARGTPEYWVARTTLWKEYQAWTTDTGEKHPASKAGFEDTLHRLGCIQAQDPSGKQRAWRGIRLTASDNPTPSDVNL